jgi:hypothetical protein
MHKDVTAPPVNDVLEETALYAKPVRPAEATIQWSNRKDCLCSVDRQQSYPHARMHARIGQPQTKPPVPFRCALRRVALAEPPEHLIRSHVKEDLLCA